MDTEINKKSDNLLFGVRRSIRYHLRRRRFFDSVHKTSTVLSALSGTATIAAVLAKAGPTLTITFAALVAIFSIIDLVVGTARAARLHDDLARRFISLEKSVVSIKEITEENLTNLTSQRLDIEADEPTPLKVLDSICHNELLRAMGYDRSEFLKIKWYQRISAQFIDVMEYKIKIRC
ncbi:hypothetical protein KAU51_04455 [Candidatus Parcubacteria bacterium]|nr:hypothetical protein [Candidatus Parcubacteria bacterium]